MTRCLVFSPPLSRSASNTALLSADIESNAPKDPAQQAAARQNLTLFTQRLRAALRQTNPAAVLIFCTTAYPNSPDSNKGAWPHFDLAALANATDWFFVMAYGSNHWADNQTAIANSNMGLTTVSAMTQRCVCSACTVTLHLTQPVIVCRGPLPATPR